MKKTILLLLIIFTGLMAEAQKIPLKPAAEVSKRIEVSKEASVISYEMNLAAGTLTLIKNIQKGDGQAYETIYRLVKYDDPTFNNSKPVRIGISRQSFDSVFTRGSTELAGKFKILDRYVSDNKLSMSNEKDWIAVIKYYNSL
ncbi:MAG: hypothetical protein V4539_22610 [Bacteroidota bacterium]